MCAAVFNRPDSLPPPPFSTALNNWRKQETMQNYAAFFPAATRELEILSSLDDGAAFGNDEWIDRAQKLQPSLMDSPFLQFLNACWLYETSPSIREKLERLEKRYRDTRVEVRRRLKIWKLELECSGETDPAREAKLNQSIERLEEHSISLWPEDLKANLQELRAKVAERYFRNGEFD